MERKVKLMSKYTTELRFICESFAGEKKSVDGSGVNEVIQLALPKIFDFDFPIFDESYRNVLETKIIKHFYTREIGMETVGLWKLKLETKLNEIMPYYNKLYNSELLEFNPLYTHDLYKKHEGSGENNGTREGRTIDSSHNEGEGWEKFSDTPQNGVSPIENAEYLTNATNTTQENTYTGQQDTAGSEMFKSSDEYFDHVYGFEGKDGSELLLKFRETFLNIDMMIIDELNELFMQLW